MDRIKSEDNDDQKENDQQQNTEKNLLNNLNQKNME